MQNLPRARNGLRATNVNNIIYVLGTETGKLHSADKNFSGGDTDILKLDLTNPSSPSWKDVGQLTEKAGTKLEISTIDCNLGKHI